MLQKGSQQLGVDLSNPQINTEVGHTALGRLGTAEDIAGAIVFLLSPQASFITGAVTVADGGWVC